MCACTNTRTITATYTYHNACAGTHRGTHPHKPTKPHAFATIRETTAVVTILFSHFQENQAKNKRTTTKIR